MDQSQVFAGVLMATSTLVPFADDMATAKNSKNNSEDPHGNMMTFCHQKKGTESGAVPQLLTTQQASTSTDFPDFHTDSVGCVPCIDSTVRIDALSIFSLDMFASRMHLDPTKCHPTSSRWVAGGTPVSYDGSRIPADMEPLLNQSQLK